MAQKIVLTEELRQAMVEEFRNKISGVRTTTSTFTYTKQLAGYKEPAALIFSPMAWIKQRILVESVDKEIAWYGLMERREDTEIPTYYVKDIVVYPQKTTAITVDVDNDIYPEWYSNQPDEFYTEMRLQGHSHVNMATSPSGTDRDHWEELIGKVPADSFFVCLITNKKLEHYVNIYDFRRNTRYDSSDVTIVIEDLSLATFTKDVNEKLTSIPTPSYSSYGYGQKTATGQAAGRTGSYAYGGWEDDGYDDDYDDPYYSSVYSSPSTPGKYQSTQPKTSTQPKQNKAAPVPPAPRNSVPSVPAYPSYYTGKFGKRG